MNFIIDKTMPNDMIHNLSNLGNIFKSTEVCAEDKAMCTHPDIQIHFVSEDIAFCPPETVNYYKQTLPCSITVMQGAEHIGRTYPSVCAYNIARIGDYVICNTKYADKTILEYYNMHGYKIIHTNQGYAKCNICQIDNSSFITEDIGIYRTVLKEEGLCAIYAEHGEVALSGFEYGFLGGASGLADGILLLCGKIPSGKLRDIILNTLKEKKLNFYELSKSALYDFGSIISF